MNAPPFPTNPQPGDVYCGWTWNGSQWICTQGQQIVMQVFTASGVYTPSPGLLSLVVECVGGGGGGGPVSTVAATQMGGGGGAGSGGMSRKALSAALVRGGIIVTVGGGGLGETDSTSPGGVYSFSGGTTSFGALCTAIGGQGGGANTSEVSWGNAGLGGAPGIGDLAVPGNPGIPGTSAGATTTLNVAGGAGGAIMGGGGLSALVPVGSSSPGFAGTGPGAGGAGGAVNQIISAGVVGGHGASGVCIVTEYCFAEMGWSGGCGCGGGGGKGMARIEATDAGWPGPRGGRYSGYGDD